MAWRQWPQSSPSKSIPLISPCQIFVSNTLDGKWTFVKSFECNRGMGMTKMVIPGEYIAKHLRVRCVNNIRGGNIVSVRLIMVKGLNRTDQSKQVSAATMLP